MAMRPRQIRKTAEYLTRKSFLTTAAGLALCYYHVALFQEDRIAELSFPTGERDAYGKLQQTEEWCALIESSGELLVSPTSWLLLKHHYDLVFRYNVRSTNHRSFRLPDWQDYRGWSNGLAAAKAAE